MEKFKENECKDKQIKYNKLVDFISLIRVIVFILAIISFFVASSNYLYIYVGIFFVVVFVFLIFIHDIYYKKLEYYNKKISIILKYRDRMTDNWKKFKDNGKDYSSELLLDLNVVGDNSLFQYLSICKTIGGRRRLIDKLSNKKTSNKELVKNQEMIEELKDNIDFDIDFQVNMLERYNDEFLDLDSGVSYLNDKINNKRIDLIIGLLFSLICLLLLFLGYIKIISYKYFYGMFIFNYLINYMYSYIYGKEFKKISLVSNLYGNLYSLYNTILKRKFISKKMNGIYNSINDSYSNIKKLMFIDNLNNLKNNILSSFIFNGLFCINIIVMYLYSRFQYDNIEKGLDSIYELEAMISLAGIGIIRDDVSMPVISNDLILKFSNIKHPLINKKKCIGNEFEGNNGVNIITGSNMGGKTSFLRTVGINLILMNSGTYVCADNFISSYFKIFTSISVNDNIDKGISTFYAELLRINNAIKYDDGNRIILVDEIFKGTNYNDRIYGAIEVIKKLNDNKTILFITTHDFELCDIKDDNINNYYVKEYYEGDNIKFDYKLRKGKCTSTNAKYLMKKLGIINSK